MILWSNRVKNKIIFIVRQSIIFRKDQLLSLGCSKT